MNYRLLIDYAVIEFIEKLPCSDQRLLRQRLVSQPQKFSDFTEHDISGRPLDIHVCGKYAIKFWQDHTDRHIKILDVHFADGHNRKSELS